MININGEIIDGFYDEGKCKKCGSETIFYETYDAQFCAKCNIWLENTCGNPDCVLCGKRPDRPLGNNIEEKEV